MSLVNDMLQDLDARWQPSPDGLQAIPQVSSLRLGESLAVPAANSIPSGLSSDYSGEQDLGRKPRRGAPIYLFAAGVLILLVVGAGVVVIDGKPSVEPVVMAPSSSPFEQLLVAEVLQSRDATGFLGMTSSDSKAEGFSQASSQPTFNAGGEESSPSVVTVVSTLVTPLFKSNKVVELQERAPTVLPVLNDVQLSSAETPSENTRSVNDKNIMSSNTPPLFSDTSSALGDSRSGTVESTVSAPNSNQRSRAQAFVAEAPAVLAAPLASIDDLLFKARRAFELQRYREPVGDNAYDLYQIVLAQDKSNAAAHAGVLAIQQAYLGLIRRVIGQNYYYKVPELAKSARAVGASQADIESVIASVPAYKARPVRDAMAQTKAYEQDKRQRKEAATQTTGKKSVSFSEQTHDQKTAQEATQLMNAGEFPAAEHMLEAYVAAQPRSQASLQALFDVYIQQQKLAEAESLIAQAQHLPGEQFSYLVARLLIQRDDIKGAIRSLTSQQPALSRNPAYYALMAALYHRLGQDQSAKALYQRLITHNKTNPSYWLGLAMARDGLGAPAALQAFRQVRRLTPKPVSYSAYVNKRIDALSRLQDQ